MSEHTEHASKFAQKIIDGDPAACGALKELAVRAKTDKRAANALKVIALTIKLGRAGNGKPAPIVSGGLPGQVFATGKHIVKFALTPAAWAISSVGKGVGWAGSQLQHLSHVI